jgi:HD-GYP domain-containing protein (c-di-GMP phosphodiesterase class II)
VELLRAGDRIGQDIFGHLGAPPLLRAGVRVSESYRRLLAQAGVTTVWIDDAMSEGIEPLETLSAETKRRAAGVIRDAYADASHALGKGQALSERTIKHIESLVEQIAAEVSGNVHAALAMNDLAHADDYTLKHSLSVTTLGLALGARLIPRYGWLDARGKQRFDGIDDRLLSLGVGLLVHDIGKLAVPQAILQKPGKLTPEEWVAMKAHPMEGVRILRHDSISPLTRAVVRSHHEKWEGGGYPEGIAGTTIHQFARIASVADVFDALSSDRHYRPAWPMHRAWHHVVNRAGRDFDPDVVAVFRESVTPYPPGTTVKLSDGTIALVKEIRPERVSVPIVRVIKDAAGAEVTPYELDLTRTPLTIVSTEADAGRSEAA